jgi:hypothetical protein
MYELATIGFENKQTAYINQILYWNFISVKCHFKILISVYIWNVFNSVYY